MKLDICFLKLGILLELALKKSLLNLLNLKILVLKLFVKSFVDTQTHDLPFDVEFFGKR